MKRFDKVDSDTRHSPTLAKLSFGLGLVISFSFVFDSILWGIVTPLGGLFLGVAFICGMSSTVVWLHRQRTTAGKAPTRSIDLRMGIMISAIALAGAQATVLVLTFPSLTAAFAVIFAGGLFVAVATLLVIRDARSMKDRAMTPPSSY